MYARRDWLPPTRRFRRRSDVSSRRPPLRSFPASLSLSIRTRMRDMPTHYKLITPPFIKFHDRCLLRQRALYASRPSLALLACSSSLADTYIIYLREKNLTAGVTTA
ncbi:hypothetical protein PUN28_011021 [Cardiocondyla obscurior]|uniref:Uncharacterized protein n=1 Tax=Cardiocondyla obscurior TaxID=286306 RepID=A0AAW2FL86_9HYME